VRSSHTAAAARTAAVDPGDDNTPLLARCLQRLEGTCCGRLVDGVDDVDVGALLQAVVHRRLALGLVTEAVGHADDLGALGELVALGVGRRHATARHEAVVTLRTLTYWPISWPALQLSVANSASVASAGSAELSRAMNITPCACAVLIAGTMTFESLGVITMVLAAAACMYRVWSNYSQARSMNPLDLFM